MSSSDPGRRLLLPISAVMVLGGVSTLAWLGGAEVPGAGARGLALALLVVIATTLVNLALRWLRLHFLLRTVGVRLRSRESLLAFSALLPMVATPWAAGELLIFLALRRQTPQPLRTAGLLWMASRGADVVSLLFLLVLEGVRWMPAIWALLALAAFLLPWVERLGDFATRFIRLLLYLGVSLLAWQAVAFGLAQALAILGGPAGAPLATLFARGTLLGSLSGLPSGMGFTGGSMVNGLIQAGIPVAPATWAVAAHRWGTTGFSLALGLMVWILLRKSLHALISGRQPASQGHFEDLSQGYASQIPVHVRDRLIETKTTVMRRILARRGVPAAGRGLDIGCGQGWYLAQFARLGHPMAGCDLTAGQIDQARAYCGSTGIPADLVVAGAENLPFADNTFDFAYAINVLHHITNEHTLANALKEITRVLRPGAPFILFEMNTLNPFFRLYMSYVFPFVRDIDDGTEVWLHPSRLPPVPGAAWTNDPEFITFVPDFLPRFLLAPLSPLESLLERSPLRRFSAHFAASLVKHPSPSP